MGIKSNPHRHFTLMSDTARRYHCCCCQKVVYICRQCDHGHRYCTDGCAVLARATSQARATKKYQPSRQGKFNNAARQQRYRDRQKQKVTHQGSPPTPSHDVLVNETRTRQIPAISTHLATPIGVYPSF